jgi:hypothetical protein
VSAARKVNLVALPAELPFDGPARGSEGRRPCPSVRSAVSPRPRRAR